MFYMYMQLSKVYGLKQAIICNINVLKAALDLLYLPGLFLIYKI